MNLDRVLELARLHPDEVFTLPCVPNTVRLVRAGRAHPDEAHMTIAVPDE